MTIEFIYEPDEIPVAPESDGYNNEYLKAIYGVFSKYGVTLFYVKQRDGKYILDQFHYGPPEHDKAYGYSFYTVGPGPAFGVEAKYPRALRQLDFIETATWEPDWGEENGDYMIIEANRPLW